MADLENIEKDLQSAFSNNSERELLAILKNNTFLFYELYRRKYGICPCFYEVSFGNTYRCDFCWLNDSSDGPEWSLVEVEKPQMKLFCKNGDPSKELTHAIEQVKSWRRYFNEFPHEKGRIFGHVSRFRWILVAGSAKDWQESNAMKWREENNAMESIEIRSSEVFLRALSMKKEHPEQFFSFDENPNCMSSSKIKNYCEESEYLKRFK